MQIKRIVATGFAAAAIVAGAAAPAFAATEHVGGGEWYHTGGGEGDTIKSEYLHPDECHSATAINSDGDRSKTTAAETYWARAAVGGTDDTDYAYWDNEATGC